MMSWEIASEKYSCSASLERLTNGSTATRGRRDVPVGPLRIRIHADDTPFDVFARAAAARAVDRVTP